MQGNIIGMISAWLCASVFTWIGIYAGKNKKPMHFWSGTTVKPESISDITAYNKANQKMWYVYATPFWITGISYIWFPKISTIIMTLSTTLGLLWLIGCYRCIEKKYKIHKP
ncbi:MAG: hypothetical protein E7231_17995 [Cellulosilyticum sp.]|nr:hypothetical protein [Cellulosilyticum sp.]